MDALKFKCDVLWVQLDALWHAYVEGQPRPARGGPRSLHDQRRAREALRRDTPAPATRRAPET